MNICLFFKLFFKGVKSTFFTREMRKAVSQIIKYFSKNLNVYIVIYYIL